MKKKNKSINKGAILKNGLLLWFPWRDALGLTLGDFPIRFGEIWSLCFGINLCTKKWKCEKQEIPIICILILNLMVSGLGVVLYSNTIDTSFAVKYLIRNVVYIIFVFGFLLSKTKFSDIEMDKLFRYFVTVQVIALVFIYSTGGLLYLCTFRPKSFIIATGQYVSLFGLRLPRFMGTCSEAGYLAPLLSFLLYYFMNLYFGRDRQERRSKELKYIIIILTLAILSFSAAVLVFVGFTAVICVMKHINETRGIKFILISVFVAFLAVTIIFQVPALKSYVQKEVMNKIIYYLSAGSRSGISNWSAMDRTQHIQNAWQLFITGDLNQILLGRGTGAYAFYAESVTSLLVNNVNEAYNLFLSTLTDRGILGFGLFLSILYFAKKMLIKGNLYSQTLFYAILMQYMHWILTGNMWLYYFWYELVLMIGLRRYYRSKKENISDRFLIERS